ncbi:MAG TPA: hypothetical protein VH333_13655 [Pseudonocardiaceae bacterium]|jgi:hypothetical protein|nr:hypothetical protein [Pseudonocardiaceae bacterium]
MDDNSGPGLRGVWYFVVTWLSFGLLAWVPFAHAAAVLRNRPLVLRSLVYAALAVLSVVLIAIAPVDAADNPTGIGTVEVLVGVLIAAGLVSLGTRDQISLRRQVYGRDQRRVLDVRPALDPAIRAIMAARKLRDAARAIAAEDPLAAHDLHIGRPDIKHRVYDDGGLVDLNAAPATAIAMACELPVSVAEAIVAARPFATVDDVVTLVEIPLSAWGTLRDRGIVIWF